MSKLTIKSRDSLYLTFVLILFSISFLSTYHQSQLLHPTNSNPRTSPPNLIPQVVPSSALLLRHPGPHFDSTPSQSRCSRYGLSYTPGISRRIFWGANIADDSWHVIATQALELRGILHTAAFVESNRTSSGDVRTLRFEEGSEGKERLIEVFGGESRVTVDYYVNDDDGPDRLVSLEREHAQRALILDRWRINGMTVHDIGYLSDTDEMFSRDFLRAMQTCHVPQFISEGKNGHERCARPKVYGSVAIFEGSPGCVSAEEIYHPALMIGECVHGIGNSTLHPKPTRNNHRSYSWRTENYTFHTYYSALHDPKNPPPPKTLPPNVYFPLYNAADFRRTPGGFFYGNDDLPLYVGYHIHNFFDDIRVLRQKYRTYGHAQTDALTKPLGDLNREVNFMVRCAMDGEDSEAMDGSVIKKYKTREDRRKHAILRRRGGLNFLKGANYGFDGGAVPLAFRIQKYVDARHEEMVRMIRTDEHARLVSMLKQDQTV